MLKPAYSLRIARLPSGLDPDDLVKQRGPAAMEALLSEARPLVDVLWDHEHEAVPLATPEDKAGLKARLMGHVDLIADPDIKALYRRELLERFSAFAFPQRQPAEWRQQGKERRPGPDFRRGREAPPLRPIAATVQLARRGATGQRRALVAAVLAGLVRHPSIISRRSDELCRLDPGEKPWGAGEPSVLAR